MNGVVVRMIALSRWVLVPFFLGLGVALLMLMVFFFVELGRFFVYVISASQIEIIVSLLSLIDLVLLASLMVIVIFAGYGNFVEKIDLPERPGRPNWMTAVSFSGLKQQLFASMMAIGGVTLLKALMKLEVSVSETQVKWLVVANIIFVASYAVLVLTDRFAHPDEGGH